MAYIITDPRAIFKYKSEFPALFRQFFDCFLAESRIKNPHILRGFGLPCLKWHLQAAMRYVIYQKGKEVLCRWFGQAG